MGFSKTSSTSTLPTLSSKNSSSRLSSATSTSIQQDSSIPLQGSQGSNGSNGIGIVEKPFSSFTIPSHSRGGNHQDKEYISKTQPLIYDVYELHDLPPIKFTVRVLYDYKAQAPEELDITQGQVLSVFKTHDDGWWEAIGLDESGKRRKGLFPSNFTEMI